MYNLSQIRLKERQATFVLQYEFFVISAHHIRTIWHGRLDHICQNYRDFIDFLCKISATSSIAELN